LTPGQIASALADDPVADSPIASTLERTLAPSPVPMPRSSSNAAFSDSTVPSQGGLRRILENDLSETQVDSGALLSSLSNMIDQLSEVDSETATSLANAVLGALSPESPNDASIIPQVQQALESRVSNSASSVISALADLLGKGMKHDPVLEGSNVDGALRNVIHQGKSIIDQITQGNSANTDPKVGALLDQVSQIIDTASSQLNDPVCAVSSTINGVPTQIVVPCADAGADAMATIAHLAPSATPYTSDALPPTYSSQPDVGGTSQGDGPGDASDPSRTQATGESPTGTSDDPTKDSQIPAGQTQEGHFPDEGAPVSQPDQSQGLPSLVPVPGPSKPLPEHPQPSEQQQPQPSEQPRTSEQPQQPQQPSEQQQPQTSEQPQPFEQPQTCTSEDTPQSPTTTAKSDVEDPPSASDGNPTSDSSASPYPVPQQGLPELPSSPTQSGMPADANKGGPGSPQNQGGWTPPSDSPETYWPSPDGNGYPQGEGKSCAVYERVSIYVYVLIYVYALVLSVLSFVSMIITSLTVQIQKPKQEAEVERRRFPAMRAVSMSVGEVLVYSASHPRAVPLSAANDEAGSGPCNGRRGFRCIECLNGWFCPPMETPAQAAPCGLGWPCYHCNSGWFCTHDEVTHSQVVQAESTDAVTRSQSSADDGNRYQYLGCFQGGALRSLGGSVPVDYLSGAMSTMICVNHCFERGYTFAATENGHECWCGETLGDGLVRRPDTACRLPCHGNRGDVCGGKGTMALFADPEEMPPLM
jgi:hypothetical protein